MVPTVTWLLESGEVGCAAWYNLMHGSVPDFVARRDHRGAGALSRRSGGRYHRPLASLPVPPRSSHAELRGEYSNHLPHHPLEGEAHSPAVARHEEGGILCELR